MVKVSELEDILDISNVQTYVINSARVVFLNERPQLRGCGVLAIKSSPSSLSSYNCETCSRVLLDAFRFCSLGCNVSYKPLQQVLFKLILLCNLICSQILG